MEETNENNKMEENESTSGKRIKILMVGDLVADPGLEAIEDGLKNVQKDNDVDVTIVNVENAADGRGFTKRELNRLNNDDILAYTLGNHTWDRMEIFKIIGDKKVVRPANLPESVPGRGYRVYEAHGLKIAVINLLGRVGLGILSENPFIVAEKAIEKLENTADIIIVDFHGEATAEKLAFGKYFDGRANIVVGTHTHVQTADNEIFPYGTGYISDLGMTGINTGVLGMKKEVAFKRFLTTLPERYSSELKGDRYIRGCVFELEESIGKYGSKFNVVSTKRINYNVSKNNYEG